MDRLEWGYDFTMGVLPLGESHPQDDNKHIWAICLGRPGEAFLPGLQHNTSSTLSVTSQYLQVNSFFRVKKPTLRPVNEL